MDELTPIHNSLRSKIRTLKRELSKLDVLELKYKGIKGKPKKSDEKRKENIEAKNDLSAEISLKRLN